MKIEIVKGKCSTLIGYGIYDKWVEIEVYKVRVYKNGELIEEKNFQEKDKAGLYALGLEQYYKFLKED